VKKIGCECAIKELSDDSRPGTMNGYFTKKSQMIERFEARIWEAISKRNETENKPIHLGLKMGRCVLGLSHAQRCIWKKKLNKLEACFLRVADNIQLSE
jgi:hypothetical protein